MTDKNDKHKKQIEMMKVPEGADLTEYKTLEEENESLKKDLVVMREIAIDMWAEDECFNDPDADCPCPEELDEEFKRRREAAK